MDIRTTLRAIAANLRWTWTPAARELFARIDAERWHACGHSPLALLDGTPDHVLETIFAAPDASAALEAEAAALEHYLGDKATWTTNRHPGLTDRGMVAYFCAEFAMHESLPIYSGGLGVLAGDHIKTASDLGVPLVGVTLKYAEGYAQQTVDAHGWQHETFPETDWTTAPLARVEVDGRPLEVAIPISNRTVHARVFRAEVGRATLYLLDTDIDGNELRDRGVCRRLYGGDRAMRIRQELVLGIGGVRLLRGLGIHPTVFHLNEGHSAFACLELVRERVGLGDTFAEAFAWVRQRTLFTTHTPVPAGHDRFDPGLVQDVLQYYRYRLGTPFDDALGLGRVCPGDPGEPFCMTVLAIKCAGASNGVSRLHGEVSRRMWHELFPAGPVQAVPIGHVTNGVHVETFLHPLMRQVYDSRLGPGWRETLVEPRLFKQLAEQIPDHDLVQVRRELKAALFTTLSRRFDRLIDAGGVYAAQAKQALEGWSTDSLTIGFARRFATYKRGDLLFRDIQRAARLLANSERPVQLVVAGKAHPQDVPGKQVIQRVIQAALDPQTAGHVVFVENYDLEIGRALVSGVDVWLNNPQRPREASGTSGQKVPLHGGVNLSVLDGWWDEGFDETNGFAIGGRDVPAHVDEQDARDLASLYEILERQVVPAYYADGERGTSARWLSYVRRSLETLSAEFSSHRMLRDYVAQYYAPISARTRAS